MRIKSIARSYLFIAIVALVASFFLKEEQHRTIALIIWVVGWTIYMALDVVAAALNDIAVHFTTSLIANTVTEHAINEAKGTDTTIHATEIATGSAALAYQINHILRKNSERTIHKAAIKMKEQIQKGSNR